MTIFQRSSLIVAAFVLSSACGEKSPPTEQPPPASSGVTDAAPQSMANPAATPAAAAPASVPPGSGVIASTEGETEGTRIDVTAFERASGDTVNLRFNLVNESSEELGMNSLLTDSSEGEYYTVGGVHLVDPVNKRKYFVVRDAENDCVCSREISAVDPGKKATLWAKFPAPPPDVQRISIVFPKFLPLDDVPLQ